MIYTISQAAEHWYGIKADPADIKKLENHLLRQYGNIDQGTIKEVFLSGEAAAYLTVNETYFFREPVHFSLLDDFLSGLDTTFLQICCAACASGCEAYSIAIFIETYNKNSKYPIHYHIDACDLNPKAIDTALGGIYSPRVLREDGNCFHTITEPFLKKSGDTYIIDGSLKKHISFFVHNLLYKLPAKKYDLVFFRNALIYFLPQKRELLLSNLSASLKEGGHFVVGVSETAAIDHCDFEQINTNDIFYFKKRKRSAVNLSLQI